MRDVHRLLDAKKELQNIVKAGETWKLGDLEDMYNVLGGGDPKWGEGIYTWLYECNKNLGKLYWRLMNKSNPTRQDLITQRASKRQCTPLSYHSNKLDTNVWDCVQCLHNVRNILLGFWKIANLAYKAPKQLLKIFSYRILCMVYTKQNQPG